MQSPVALELLELLATTNIPQADRPVTRRTDEKLCIRGAELDAIDAIEKSDIWYLELLELLARSYIPQPDAVVVISIMPAARCEHGAV
jgi:hypothetical protein